MSRSQWAVVTTYATSSDADIAIEQLKSAGIAAVRRENEIGGFLGSGSQRPTAPGISVLAPWNVVGDACKVLGVAPAPDAEHALRAMWENAANWNRDGSYRGADDPRLIVRKKSGVGWTLNMAHRRAQAAIWLVLLAAAAAVIAIGFFATR